MTPGVTVFVPAFNEQGRVVNSIEVALSYMGELGMVAENLFVIQEK